jgi:hypothetical protein
VIDAFSFRDNFLFVAFENERGISMEAELLLSLALRVVAEHSVQGVLNTIVEGLAAQPEVALARIWLLSPGDICDGCVMRDKCSDQTQCLH